MRNVILSSIVVLALAGCATYPHSGEVSTAELKDLDTRYLCLDLFTAEPDERERIIAELKRRGNKTHWMREELPFARDHFFYCPGVDE